MKRIRSGYGIGDNLYLQSVCRFLVEHGRRLQICTDWPEVFLPLKGKVDFDKFSRHNIDILAHYTQGKKDQSTSQWEDVCKSAGIPRIDMQLDWQIQNPAIVDLVKRKAGDRKIIAVLMPRAPMGRNDGFGAELLPHMGIYQKVIKPFWTVQLGKGRALHDLTVNMDMANKTSLTEMIDIASIADGFIGYPSFFVPLAESFKKPAFFVWASAGLRASTWFIRTITPDKLLHRKNYYVFDTWPDMEINAKVREFVRVIDEARYRGAVSREAGSDSRQCAVGPG